MKNTTDKQMQTRNSQMRFFHLIEGVKATVRPPFLSLLPILTLTVLLYIALKKCGAIFDLSVMPEQISKFANKIFIAAIITVFFVLLIAVLSLLGKPYKQKTAEEKALEVFKLTQSMGKCPILISSSRTKCGARRWIFFSKWVPMRVWREDNNKNAKDICSALGCHLASEIEYGEKNNCHRIVFYTKPGAEHEEGGVIYDDEF